MFRYKQSVPGIVLAVAILLGDSIAAWGQTAPGDLLITLGDPPSVLRYSPVTGIPLGDFVTPGSGGIDLPQTLTYGPDGNLYVASFGSRNVLRYNGKTGAFIDAFVPAGRGGLGGPYGVTFGPDGNLYVTSFFFASNPGVLRYDGTTGALISTFITAEQVPLPFDQCIVGMAFGPDKNFYLVGYYSTVYRYDGETGEFINSYGTGLRGTSGLTFTPFPTSKDQCKQGGWRGFGFKSQGQCIKFVNTDD